MRRLVRIARVAFALVGGGRFDDGLEAPFGLLQALLVGVAEIDRQRHLLSDDVDEVGGDLEAADRSDLVAAQL